MAEPSCSYCPRLATFRVEGWIEDGESTGAGYVLTCDEHVKIFQADDPETLYLHGYDSVSAIISLVAENG